MRELSGVGVALITPFKKNLDVDYDALEKVINHCIKGGVQYLVSLGTTGETPVLSKAEKTAIFNFTCEVNNNRLPVVLGAGGNYTDELIASLSGFDTNKAVAILSASPYYNKPSQQGLVQHYTKLADNAPLPLILYNVPGRTGRNMETATTLELAKHKNIIAIKEASGNMQQCMEILRDKPANFMVISGDDGYALPQIACGMAGVISVVTNAYPKEFTAMVEACLKNEYEKARRLNNKLMPVYDLMFTENNPAGVKAFMAQINLIQNHLRLPGVPVSSPLLKRIKAFLNG